MSISVLGLFDGMSCGQIALHEAGIEYENYYASEIDKWGIQITQKNYPNTIQLGDVTQVRAEQLPKIELMLGGSPCQSFSKHGDKSGFDGESKLFWEYVRLLKEVKPTYFLFENVMMKKEWEDIITEALGVKPIKITSEMFVPQKRVRLYWTNIPGVVQPEQRKYNVQDIIDTPEGFPSSCGVDNFFKRKKVFNTLPSSYWKGIRAAGRPAVSTKEGFQDDDRSVHRMLTPSECEKLQGIPQGFTDGIPKTYRYQLIGNGWTIPVISYILSFLKTEQISFKKTATISDENIVEGEFEFKISDQVTYSDSFKPMRDILFGWDSEMIQNLNTLQRELLAEKLKQDFLRFLANF